MTIYGTRSRVPKKPGQNGANRGKINVQILYFSFSKGGLGGGGHYCTPVIWRLEFVLLGNVEKVNLFADIHTEGLERHLILTPANLPQSLNIF